MNSNQYCHSRPCRLPGPNLDQHYQDFVRVDSLDRTQQLLLTVTNRVVSQDRHTSLPQVTTQRTKTSPLSQQNKTLRKESNVTNSGQVSNCLPKAKSDRRVNTDKKYTLTTILAYWNHYHCFSSRGVPIRVLSQSCRLFTLCIYILDLLLGIG